MLKKYWFSNQKLLFVLQQAVVPAKPEVPAPPVHEDWNESVEPVTSWAEDAAPPPAAATFGAPPPAQEDWAAQVFKIN